jgi:hypothetical protein
MSHAAIAAALTLDGISTPERLVAFSMASYANREHRAWPSAAAAAARAGMSRGRFLAARDGLVRAGMLVIEESRGGRGRSSTVLLAFAEARERLDADINAQLFEGALVSSRARGAARLLVAVMAALASDDGQLSGFSTGELATAAGLSNTSYRRARSALLASREVRLDTGLGGRGNTNAWTLTLPDGVSPARPSRAVPPAEARPLLASVRSAADGQGRDARYQARGSKKSAGIDTVSASKGAVAGTVCPGKGASTRTVLKERAPKRAPKRAPQTPPPNARTGREPQNPRTQKDPPAPLWHESSTGSLAVEESYLTDRGRRRRRKVYVDLGEVRRGLALPTTDDQGVWERIRGLLGETVGESRFAIWLAGLELVAVDRAGKLVVGAPPETAVWVWDRFGRALTTCAQRLGRELRIVTGPERAALERDRRRLTSGACGCEIDEREVS